VSLEDVLPFVTSTQTVLDKEIALNVMADLATGINLGFVLRFVVELARLI